MTTLETNHLRIRLIPDANGYTGYTLDAKQDNTWRPAGTGHFGRLVSRTTAGERQETALVPTTVEATTEALRLTGRWTDADGIAWDVAHELRLGEDPRQVLVRHTATPAEGRQVLHFSGPTLLAGSGEGGFGAAKTDALFPGLEYLLDDEESSSTRFAAEQYAGRSVPHPSKIAVPMMAVSHDGLAVGLLWDPNQAYGSAWRHPAAVFSSPNRLDGFGGADGHALGLFAPGVGRFVPENALEATQPIGASPTNPLSLEARLVVLTGATAIDVLKHWVETEGLPDCPAPHSWTENVDLCVRSYLDVAWDDATDGWHHTLADPWGPRYEPRVIAQLHRYAQWADADPALRDRSREQVRRGLEKALPSGAADGNPAHKTTVPHLDLALHRGMVAQSLAGTEARVRELIAAQAPDGSWPWTKELIQVAVFDTEERRAALGGEDSSSGLTAERALPLLAWARMTGDAAAREAGLRAVAWCNAQRRPEGAQTWELHLHVPDILAVPSLVDANLEAHALTGDAAFLAQADRWAWTGLPFTYLWRAYFRPIMAYATIPCFGVTMHDVQSWFGVDVQWNGLVYADALFRLAATTGDERWRTVALGIVACGMQQQPLDGPWRGMYPDAVSVVRGDEEYTWWLNPNLIGLNTFELAGIPLDLETTVVARNGAAPVRITSGATVSDATAADGALTLRLGYPVGESSFSLIGGMGEPRAVRVDGEDLGRVEDVDGVERGWAWLAGHGLAVVKVGHDGEGTRAVTVSA